MEVILCRNNSENAVIGKDIRNIKKVSCTVKDMFNVERPVIRLSYDGNIHEVNYVYISEFKRYYFVKEKHALKGEVYEIYCEVDVLQSFKEDILALQCIVDKQENAGVSNMYINDGSYVMTSRNFNRAITFPNGFNETGTYILICAGGSGNE